MLNNGNKECPLADQIVSYMYGEIGDRSELEFETHLADCMTCTDEFATVSQARFSVYEWQKEEFAHLPTPEIVIPYPSTVDVGETIGLAAAVRAWLGRLSFPVAVAAALAVCIGLGLLALNLIGRKDQPIAVNTVIQAVIPNIETPARPVPEPGMVETVEKKVGERTPQPGKAVLSQPHRLVKRSSPAVNNPSNIYAVGPKQAAPAPKTPALNAYDDSDDNSLRLADLFDEVGG